MSASERREIAARGGRASHGGRGYDDRDESRFSRERESGAYEPEGRRDFSGGRSDWGEERHGAGRGFASMEPERRRELASRGGRASHGGLRDYDDARSGRDEPRFRRSDYDEGGYYNAPRDGRGRSDYEEDDRGYRSSGPSRFSRDDYGPGEESRFSRERSRAGNEEEYEGDDRSRRFSDEDDDYDYAVRERGQREYDEDAGAYSRSGLRRGYGTWERDRFRSPEPRGGRGRYRDY